MNLRYSMTSRLRMLLPAVIISAISACGGGAPQAGSAAGAGAMPPTEVQTITLAEKPIPLTTDFLATVRSLRSTTIQPQVEGIVTRMSVKSGDRVRAGQPLVQINPDKQQAAVSSLESARLAREADVAFAKQQLRRMQTLIEAGAVSRQELEQAEVNAKTAEAQLAAIEAQIRESRVELQYYRVDAPTSGVIGDIPVRVGDRVTPSTVITTIDAGQDLEAYISVPLEQAGGLKLGLPVELLDEKGTVTATNPVTFVAPRADDATQTVLVKSLLRQTPSSLRVMQYIRARIVWKTEMGLVVPVVAVNRVTGAFFCFVAEPEGQGYVARQRPVQVGEVIGNEYIVRSGLRPGQRVIVSGIQKLRDGVPVKPSA